MNNTKKWFYSKIIWVAVIQAVLGIIVAVSTEYPIIGELAIAKSVIDIILRAVTNAPIGK